MPNRAFLGWAVVVVLVTTWISLFISLQLGVALLFFSIVGWWAWQHPEYGLLFFMVISPVLPLLKFTQTGGLFTLLKDVLIIVLFLRIYAWPALTKRLSYRRIFLFTPLVLLAIWTLVATLRGDALILSILRARDILLYPLLYFGVLYLPQTAKILRERFYWFTATFFITLALSICQWFFALDSAVLRFDPGRSIWIPRLSSTFGHPTVFGEYLILAIVLFTAIALYTSSLRWRVVYATLALATVPFIYLTYSRGVWLGLVGAVGSMGLVHGWQWLKKRKAIRLHTIIPYIALSVAVAILSLILIWRFTTVNTFIRSAFDPSYASNEERLEFIARLIGPMSNTQALLGKGLGDVLAQNFRTVTIDQYDVATGDDREVQLSKDSTLVDNQYLKTFVEMGLVGILIYSWIYWRFFKSSFLSLYQTTPYARIIGLAGVGFMVSFIIQGMFVDIWDVFPTNALFWIMAGIVSATNTKTLV